MWDASQRPMRQSSSSTPPLAEFNDLVKICSSESLAGTRLPNTKTAVSQHPKNWKTLQPSLLPTTLRLGINSLLSSQRVSISFGPFSGHIGPCTRVNGCAETLESADKRQADVYIIDNNPIYHRMDVQLDLTDPAIRDQWLLLNHENPPQLIVKTQQQESKFETDFTLQASEVLVIKRIAASRILGWFSFGELCQNPGGQWMKTHLTHPKYKTKSFRQFLASVQGDEDLVRHFKKLAEEITNIMTDCRYFSTPILTSKRLFEALIKGVRERIDDDKLISELNEVIMYLFTLCWRV